MILRNADACANLSYALSITIGTRIIVSVDAHRVTMLVRMATTGTLIAACVSVCLSIAKTSCNFLFLTLLTANAFVSKTLNLHANPINTLIL